MKPEAPVDKILRQAEESKGSLPGWLSSEMSDIVKIAALFGWSIHLDSSGSGIGLRSYSGGKIIHLSARTKSGPTRRMRKDLLKYAHPDIKRSLAGKDGEAEDYKALMKHIRSIRDATVMHADPPPAPRPVPRPPPSAVRPPTAPSVISEVPMVAKGGEHLGYTSATTNVRTWTDGRRDYTCRYEGCDFSSENRLGPSSHWAGAHRDTPVGKPVEVYEADVSDAAVYAPRQTRVEALAALLKSLYEGDDPDFDDIARRALTWVHEQSNQGTYLAGEREPLTAEEMLVRIRALLDTGEQGRLAEENERLTKEMVRLTDQAREAQAEAQSIREQWQALSELVTGVPQERSTA